MFNDDIFETWLDIKSKELVNKISNSQALSSEEMIIFIVKAQSNHFHNLYEDIRADVQRIKEDTKELREDMNKRFDAVILRMDRFIIGSLVFTMISIFIILGFMYKMTSH